MPSNIEGDWKELIEKAWSRGEVPAWAADVKTAIIMIVSAEIKSAEERGMRRVIAAVRGKEPVTAAGTTEQAQNKADAVLPFMHGQWETDLKAAESLIPKE